MLNAFRRLSALTQLDPGLRQVVLAHWRRAGFRGEIPVRTLVEEGAGVSLRRWKARR